MGRDPNRLFAQRKHEAARSCHIVSRKGAKIFGKPIALSLSKPVRSACKAVEGDCSCFWAPQKEERCFDKPSTNGQGVSFAPSRLCVRPSFSFAVSETRLDVYVNHAQHPRHDSL
jgi:hypothetical protein